MSLADFGIPSDAKTIKSIAEYTVENSVHVRNEPVNVSVESLAKAITAADFAGRNGCI